MESSADGEALPDFSEQESFEASLENFEATMGEAATDAAGGQPGGEAPPDFSEQESFEVSLENFEATMGEAATNAAGGQPGDGFPGQGEASGSSAETAGGYSAPGGPARAGSGQRSGAYGGGQATVNSSGSGIITGAEQVAILDEQLNRGTGAFDELILRERETIRRTAKNGSRDAGEEDLAGSGYRGPGAGREAGQYQVPPMAGGGAPGPNPRDSYDGEIPRQTATYPPPADIPTGTDDDVVARQLREAAMREPDPALREKLWDEYRKYKGIDQ